MAVPQSMSDIKSKLLRPATTSNFYCEFRPPNSEEYKKFTEQREKSNAGIFLDKETQELISLSCFDTSLPGSGLQTANLQDSYTGVNETYAYRRAYDNRADFSFYVDHNDNLKGGYKVILFFENWIAFISNERFRGDVDIKNPNYFYRMNYPEDYIGQVTIEKFERDHTRGDAGDSLLYTLWYAYPLSMTSMPVSYEASQVLKCTVSFSYQRYTVQRNKSKISP
jgi:hypothetical protein